VNEKGVVEEVKITSSCGFDYMDEKMLSLIENMPGIWVSARDAEGNPTSQDLVFYYGKMGC
jgi:hypothetical protein